MSSQCWPCVIPETALSEADSKLSSDVHFWPDELEGDVKVVFTTSVHLEPQIITINKWELYVEIKKENNNCMDGPGQPLVLEFEKLFLRTGNIPRETDIELREAQPKASASRIREAHNKESLIPSIDEHLFIRSLKYIVRYSSRTGRFWPLTPRPIGSENLNLSGLDYACLQSCFFHSSIWLVLSIAIPCRVQFTRGAACQLCPKW